MPPKAAPPAPEPVVPPPVQPPVEAESLQVRRSRHPVSERFRPDALHDADHVQAIRGRTCAPLKWLGAQLSRMHRFTKDGKCRVLQVALHFGVKEDGFAYYANGKIAVMVQHMGAGHYTYAR